MARLGISAVCTVGVSLCIAGCRPSQVKKLYWVQPLKGHPVHQLTQIGFREGCRQLGYQSEVIGTDTPDVAGTIALAEQALARGDASGMAIWTGDPAFNPFIEKAAKAGVPIVLPHFPVPEGSVPGATGVISCDPAAYAREAAKFMGKEMGGKAASTQRRTPLRRSSARRWPGSTPTCGSSSRNRRGSTHPRPSPRRLPSSRRTRK
jgi:ABC-type sugar transport system substrate-binding protein